MPPVLPIAMRCLFLLLMLMAASAAARPLPLSDSAQVSLVTILPGRALYAAFGHSALRVYDPGQGIDWLFNYGTFDFSSPWFLPKFVYGQLDYFLSVSDYARSVQFYRDVEGRPIIEQRLNLTPAQRDTLMAFLLWNARPENRTYRYDFLLDNCSTRIRDVLERTLGAALCFTYQAPATTFRHLLDLYVADRPLLQLGFYLTLGLRVDRLPTPPEVMFLPLELKKAFDQAQVHHDTIWVPLVTRTDTVFWPAGYQPLPQPAWPWLTVLGWGFFILSAGVTLRSWQRRSLTTTRWDAVLFGTAGLVGLLLLLLWVATLHTVTAWNWNLLWAWPSHLGVSVRLWRRRPPSRQEVAYLKITGLLTFMLALSWFWWPQHLHPALQPIALLLVMRTVVRLVAFRPFSA